VVAVAVSTFSSREFNQDTGRAKNAASRGPVFITDRGRPAHVLLTFAEYQRLTGGRHSIVDALSAPPDEADIDFDITPSRELARAADLS
jgi:prevent-host-death family protein